MMILSFDPERRTNARAISHCAELGYLRTEDFILDATFGLGRFWTEWRPISLATNDLDPARGAQFEHDFRDMAFIDRCFDAVVFDPPYKLNGTPSKGGPASSDSDYGVGAAMRWQDRHLMIEDGIDECARVAKRMLLIKCQDQVCSGKVRWQTHLFAERAARNGFRLVDALHVYGWRAQPPGRRQVHAAHNYSTLLVTERER